MIHSVYLKYPVSKTEKRNDISQIKALQNTKQF